MTKVLGALWHGGRMPDAPPPRYNDQGRPLGDWIVVVRYDSLRDAMTLSWTRDATQWAKRWQGAVAYPSDELEDLMEGLRTQVQVLAAPRLF